MSVVQQTRKRWLGWKVVSLLGRHRRTLVGLIVLILIAASLDIAVPFLTQGLIGPDCPRLADETARFGSDSRFCRDRDFLRHGGNADSAVFLQLRLLYAASQCEDEMKSAAFHNFLALPRSWCSRLSPGRAYRKENKAVDRISESSKASLHKKC